VAEQDAAAKQVVLHYLVTDSGIGIPEEKHADIFEPFRQADGSTTRRFGGTGLGLAISATLVEMMGGRIWVESEVDEGSTFHFTARVGIGDATLVRHSGLPAPLPGAMLPSDVPDRRLQVLIAEDNAVNQRLAATLLERRGHKVRIASNGREAVAALEQHSFDVVLMDVQMPEMGGFEATAVIRERERSTGAHIPIVAMTAHAMKGDRERCLAAGMDDYLTKPLDSRQLCAAVERAAGLQAAPEADNHHASLSDRVLARVGGDHELLADISRLFIEDAPRHLDAIRAALDRSDGDALARAAHALKGAAANFEHDRLVDAARVMEETGRASRFSDGEAQWRELSTAASDLISLLQAVAR